MSKKPHRKSSKLQVIADTLGIPADRLSSCDAKVDGLFGALECLQLFLAIKTEDGRSRAVEFLRQIVDNEQS